MKFVSLRFGISESEVVLEAVLSFVVSLYVEEREKYVDVGDICM